MPPHPPLLDLAIIMAQSSGNILRSQFDHPVRYKLKADQTFVSEADMASHHNLKQMITYHYPEHGILSEEDTDSFTDKNLSCPYLWILDPLDGTSNFIHKLPYFCVTISCVEITQAGAYQPVVGVSYNPISGELFYAQAGYGAYKTIFTAEGSSGDPQPLKMITARPLHDTFVACGFHGDHLQGDYENQYTSLIKQAESSRRCGAAALDLAHTAEGVFHVFFDDNVKIWDYAAGSLLIQEVGGVCYAFPKHKKQTTPQSLYRAGISNFGMIAGAPGVVDEVYNHFNSST